MIGHDQNWFVRRHLAGNVMSDTNQATNPAVILNPRQLKSWIGQLPVNDIIKTVKRLHTAIEQCNELQIDVDKRLKLLEIYREAFDKKWIQQNSDRWYDRLLGRT